MSIDKVQLPAFSHKSIFKNHLVNLREDVINEIPKEEPGIQFLGNNEKKIIFLVNDSKNKFLPDAQMKFLSGLLAACHLNMADIAIVNIYHKKITYNELIDQLPAEKILAFGISAVDLELPFNIPFFQAQNFQQKIYMTGPRIEEIQNNIDLKKLLWGCLQKIFNIKGK
jgi:hypothetical protein